MPMYFQRGYNIVGKLAVFFLCLTLICTLCLSVCVSMTMSTFDTEDNIFIVTESKNGSRWSQLFQADIFEDGIIAPGSKGDYSFSMQNNGNFVIDAAFDVTDENLANIPMKFRVRDEFGSFVCGSDVEWVGIEDLRSVKVRLQPNTDTNLLLEWFWPGDDDVLDTASGIVAQDDVTYILNLQVHAEQVGDKVNDCTHIDVPTGNMTTQYLIIAIVVTTMLAILFIVLDMRYRCKTMREAGVSSHD